MARFLQLLQLVLSFALPLVGFYVVRRRAGHTRAQLVGGATLGGGLSGALIAAVAAAGGTSVLEALPWAMAGLLSGIILGVVGVAAFAFGRWLGGRP